MLPQYDGPTRTKHTIHLDHGHLIVHDFLDIVRIQPCHHESLYELAHLMMAKRYYPNVKFIHEIFIEEAYRRRGYGKQALQEWCSQYPDTVILLEAGALFKVEGYELSDEQLIFIKDRLCQFYVKAGFMDVNWVLGEYTTLNTFIYPNRAFRYIRDSFKS